MLSKAKIKFIASLKIKKQRLKQQLFTAEGAKTIDELITSSSLVREIYCLESWFYTHKELLSKATFSCEVVDENELNKISSLTTPHEVLAVCSIPKNSYSEATIKQELCLALDGIHDPGNMGTIIRIADWFNIPYIFCSDDCVDAYNAKTVQASMGSIARVKVFETNLEKLFTEHSKIPVLVAVLNGESVFSMKKVNRGFLLIGNEAKGVSENLLNYATNKITIPKTGQAESLNAAVATGIICAVIKNGEK
jgi:TrmH family RNA methyltransferase